MLNDAIYTYMQFHINAVLDMILQQYVAMTCPILLDDAVAISSSGCCSGLATPSFDRTKIRLYCRDTVHVNRHVLDWSLCGSSGCDIQKPKCGVK